LLRNKSLGNPNSKDLQKCPIIITSRCSTTNILQITFEIYDMPQSGGPFSIG